MPVTCLVAKTIMKTQDWLSRSFSNCNIDFSLSNQTLACVTEQLPFLLKVDTFASKYSFKLSHYVNRYWKVDAFSFH